MLTNEITPAFHSGVYGVYAHDLEQSMDQPFKVANPGRGQLNHRVNEYFPVPIHADAIKLFIVHVLL